MADGERKGLLGRVRRRARRVVQKVKGGVEAIHEEAKHPGRPPSHQAADSPFWQDPDKRMPKGQAREAAPPAPAPDVPQPTDTTDRDGEPFWFMEGGEDLDGWNQTNPSEAWRERHGVDDKTLDEGS